jgi:hypothetical protein
LESKLLALSLLEAGWDGEDGLPTNRNVLNCVKSILPRLDRFSEPSFCPVPTGSVDILWGKEGVECCLSPKSLSMHFTASPYQRMFYELPTSFKNDFVFQVMTAWLDLKCETE